MDNHIFRNALNGFNRQDVISYIEKSQKEAAERAAQLEQELEQLREQKAKVEGELESSVQEREALAEQLADQTKLLDESRSTCAAAEEEKEALSRTVSE